MFLIHGDPWGVKLEQLTNSRDVERQHYTCSRLRKTSIKRKSVPQPPLATRQQNPDVKAEIPFKQRPPPPQSWRKCVWVARKQPQLLRQHWLQAAVAFTRPHQVNSPEDTLQSQSVNKREDYRSKLKSKCWSLRRNLSIVSYWWPLEWVI